ncbi:hypothetical protein CHS0354_033085 [Potamilus streckersoni]|uniref:Thioredoxin domain-containing protein n=1 Tax=Potamilus streckersoni TaxID=2493646 RepID=A0AAE0RYN4_9BIVA|nr:hypothetical protein CHS0354_033085 [Potamilus streckersoni]
MAWKLRLHLTLILTCLTSFASASLVINPAPLEVSEGNWRKILEGEWMVKFMAPWCPACNALKSTWEEFATKAASLEVSVGTIDVTENPGLSGRFLVTALPTIYHVKDGVFRQYTLGRKVSDLTNFIQDGTWENVTPVSWYTAPDSFQMGLVALFFRTAMQIRNFYTLMSEEYGIPEWACYLIFAVFTIIVGLILGLLIVCCCDFLMTTKEVPSRYANLSQEGDDYEDLIDDTQDDKPLEEELNDKDEEEEETKVRRRQVEKESSDNK